MITDDPVKLALLYQLPVISNCVKTPDVDSIRRRLAQVLYNQRKLTLAELDGIFKKAASRRRKYAQENSLNPESLEAVQGYWRVGHNALPEIPEFCQTRLRKVIEIKERRIGSDRRTVKIAILEAKLYSPCVVLPRYHWDLQVGDSVYTHNGFVAEIVPVQEK